MIVVTVHVAAAAVAAAIDAVVADMVKNSVHKREKNEF